MIAGSDLRLSVPHNQRQLLRDIRGHFARGALTAVGEPRYYSQFHLLPPKRLFKVRQISVVARGDVCLNCSRVSNIKAKDIVAKATEPAARIGEGAAGKHAGEYSL